MRYFAGLILGISVLAGTVNGVSPSVSYLTTESYLIQADEAYAKRTDPIQAMSALSFYEQAVRWDSSSAEACWKASRTAWWIGDHAPARAEKLAYFQKGVDYAKEALTLKANSVEAHFWQGVNLGSYGEARGILKSLFLIKPMRREMAEVIRIDDRYNGGGGYRILGIMDYKVPAIAGGNKERSLEELNKALAIEPQNPFTLYYIAEYYSIIGNKDKARQVIHALEALSPKPESEPDLKRMQEKGRKLVEKL